MKKLLLTIIACVATLVANAGTLYLVGSGTVDGKALGGSPNGNCLAITSATNVYTFKVQNVGWLKISDTNASDWATFNKNGFTIEGKGDYALTPGDLGKTLTLWYGNGSSEAANNINPPSSGEYTYTLTVGTKGQSNSTLVVTAASDEKITYEIYLRGSFNNFDPQPAYKFTNLDDENYELKGVTLSKGVTFKIADANWGAMNFGGAGNVNANTNYTLTYNGEDMTLNQDISNATVQFNVNTHVMKIVDEKADPDVPVEPDYQNWWVNIGGEFNDNNFYDGGVQPVNKIATFTNQAIGNKGFKIKTYHDGTDYYYISETGGDVATDTWVQFAQDGFDINVKIANAPADGVYEVQYNVATNQIYIKQTNGSVVDPEPDPELSSVYVVGDGEGLSWELPGKEYKVEDGVVTFTVNNLGKFKVSKSGSNDWDVYNAEAYATGSTTFGDAVYPDGQTLPIVSWGDDQVLPWTGNYTITVNFNDMTMTAKTSTEMPTEAPEVYIRGIGNNWDALPEWQFELVSWDKSTQTGSWKLENVTIPLGSSFKIADANWGSVDFGGAEGIEPNVLTDLYYGSQTNLTLAGAFVGDVEFAITSAKSTATILFSMEGEVEDPEVLYVIGTLVDGAWNPMVGVEMTNNGESVYTAKEVVLVESDGSTGFAITAALGTSDSDWAAVNALRFGPSVTDTPAVIGENTDVATGDLTWSFEPGTYTMVFDLKEKVLTISEAKADGIGTIEAANCEAIFYNLQGQRVANPDKGIYIRVQNGKAAKVVK